MEGSPASVSTKRVLFATDFSDCAAAALPYALTLAGQEGGKLLAVHVVSLGLVAGTLRTRVSMAMNAQGLREAQESMKQLESRLKDVPYDTLVRSGDVWSEIETLVRSKSVDVVVLGTHGRTGFGKVLFGSVAERIVRHARFPVMTIGPHVQADPQGMQQLHEIVYATDFSEESQAALGYALALARSRGARLYLLHVARAGADVDAHLLEDRLRQLVPPEAGLACEPKALVRAGSPPEEIVNASRELGADLIVIGPKRHSGLPGTMATSYGVVTQAHCPVLTVRG